MFLLHRINDVLHVRSHCHLHQLGHGLHQEFELPRLRSLDVLVNGPAFIP